LETVVIPTNKPNVRKDANDLIYRTEEDKYKAVIRDVKERNKLGQPILIGTISIEKNEILASMMELEGLHPQMLNAKNHQKEAEIISQAGRLGSITLATDNDYLRLLGESGLLGFLTFISIPLFFIIHTIPLIFKKSLTSQNYLSLILFSGLLATLANAIFIDIFEASKTAYSFWIMMGIYYQSLFLKTTSND
jgi:uncharacterized membrane protein YwzB